MMWAHIEKFQSTSEVCEKCSKKFAYFNQRKNCGNCMKALCGKHLHQKMYLYHKYRALHENSSKWEDVIDERGEKIKQLRHLVNSVTFAISSDPRVPTTL